MADATITLDANVAQYIQKLEKAVQKTQQVGRQTKEVQKGWKESVGSLNAALLKVGGIGAGIGLIKQAWSAYTQEIRRSADELRRIEQINQNLAGGIGMPGSADELQAMFTRIAGTTPTVLDPAGGLQRVGEAYAGVRGSATNMQNLEAATAAGAQVANVGGENLGTAFVRALATLENEGITGPIARDLALSAAQNGQKGVMAVERLAGRYRKEGGAAAFGDFSNYMANLDTTRFGMNIQQGLGLTLEEFQRIRTSTTAGQYFAEQTDVSGLSESRQRAIRIRSGQSQVELERLRQTGAAGLTNEDMNLRMMEALYGLNDRNVFSLLGETINPWGQDELRAIRESNERIVEALTGGTSVAGRD